MSDTAPEGAVPSASSGGGGAGLRPAGADAGRGRGRRLLILAEGFSSDPHHGKTGSRRAPLPARAGRRDPRLDACRRDPGGIPDRRLRRGGPGLRADYRARRRRDHRRALPACVAQPGRGLHRGRPRHRERPPRVHLRRSRARGARRPSRSRAARPPEAAGGTGHPDGRQPHPRSKRRTHGGLGLRDREDDGVARARRRSAAARREERVRPDRPDRHRDRGVGDLG